MSDTTTIKVRGTIRTPGEIIGSGRHSARESEKVVHVDLHIEVPLQPLAVILDALSDKGIRTSRVQGWLKALKE